MTSTPARHETRASTSESAEADLSALWRDLAHETPDARAIMSNLVIFRERPDVDDVDVEGPLRDRLLVEVARCHPSRILLLVHARSDLVCRTPLPAAVGILTFGPAEARHAVEQIAVRSLGLEQALPSIVRRLVLGDLPTSVWWAEDLSSTPPLGDLATMGRQFVYDSRRWRDVRAGIATLAGLIERPHAPDLADLNWRRLAPLRQGVSRGLNAFAGPAAARRAPAGAPPSRIQLRHAPGEDALAWLMAGWLTSHLARLPTPQVTVTRQDPGTDHLLAISIGAADGEAVTATMSEHQVEVSWPSAEVPFVMTVPKEREADAVAAELWTLGRDVGLIEAVRGAHTRLIE